MHPASMYDLSFSVWLVSITFSINFDVLFIAGRRRSSDRVKSNQHKTKNFILIVEARTSVVSDTEHKPRPCWTPESCWLPRVPNSSSFATLENHWYQTFTLVKPKKIRERIYKAKSWKEVSLYAKQCDMSDTSWFHIMFSKPAEIYQ